MIFVIADEAHTTSNASENQSDQHGVASIVDACESLATD